MNTFALLLAALRVGIIGLDTSHAVSFTRIMNVDKDPEVEPLVTIMGTGVDRVSCFRNDTEDVVNAVWSDGRMGELRLMRDYWVYSGYILPEKRAEGESPIVVFSKSAEGYKPLVRQIARFFKTGVPPVSPDETLEVFAFMEAAEMSAKRGGEPVTIAEAIAASTDAPWWKFW